MSPSFPGEDNMMTEAQSPASLWDPRLSQNDLDRWLLVRGCSHLVQLIHKGYKRYRCLEMESVLCFRPHKHVHLCVPSLLDADTTFDTNERNRVLMAAWWNFNDQHSGWGIIIIITVIVIINNISIRLLWNCTPRNTSRLILIHSLVWMAYVNVRAISYAVR